MTESPETLVSTVVSVRPPYKAPPGPVPGVIKDTTLTDSPVGNGMNTAPNPLFQMTGTTETGAFGAVAAGSPALPVAPAAPTLVSGDRYVQVSWAAVADPHATAKVTQYVIESDTGGHVYAARNATSVKVENVTGGRAQKYRVAAVNKNGDGPFGPWSVASVSPGNEDLVRPGSITARNAVNPIYRQDGTIVPGSYGAPKAPGKPTVAAGATTTANVTWTAPSSGQPSGGYDVMASSGQKVHVGPAVLTANVPGLTLAAVVTFTVTAVGQLQSATSAASNSYTVV
ncbi:fibronectin type III domain-containing protein [Streptomyces sp. NBC_01242]|uniref:fibronectin type III domain-containing protein n=1 Tax=Streptomyces sp. NBC_01242 TaxID=2903795 RepID=UPI002253BE21|nr:fibronectin type III domain-containing protein [Streptomyces sp. NBC_01242]MCX4799566.1 fibronectin type III domain-containing protein [Streptomyces sp. NBC_01242]